MQHTSALYRACRSRHAYTAWASSMALIITRKLPAIQQHDLIKSLEQRQTVRDRHSVYSCCCCFSLSLLSSLTPCYNSICLNLLTLCTHHTVTAMTILNKLFYKFREKGTNTDAGPHQQKFYARVTHIRGNRRSQPSLVVI